MTDPTPDPDLQRIVEEMAPADNRVHDYTFRTWGHDYIIGRVEDGGKRLHVSGWGEGIRAGHFILLPNGETSTRYQVSEIKYMRDPRDQWFAVLRFAPRETQP